MNIVAYSMIKSPKHVLAITRHPLLESGGETGSIGLDDVIRGQITAQVPENLTEDEELELIFESGKYDELDEED